MSVYRTATEPTAIECARLFTKLAGYPKRGVHVGGGRHVDMPETWDGTGDTPPGWTARIRHRADSDRGGYRVDIAEQDVALLDGTERDRLATDEQTSADTFRAGMTDR